MLDFIPADSQPVVPNVQDVPKELDIFFKSEANFLPEGKTFADLTPEELTTLKERYKYTAMVPGLYQQVTGFGNM